MTFCIFSIRFTMPGRLAMLLILPVLLLMPVAFAANQPVINGHLDFTEDAYRINVGDILSVNVYNQADLSGANILVRSDGSASFNGIGEVQAAGKTLREATLLIENQLRDLILDPRVSLTVSEGKPLSVYLAGAVMRPGTLQPGGGSVSGGASSPSEGGSGGGSSSGGSGSSSSSSLSRMDFRLSSVLSAAGGVQLNADLANIMISRNGKSYRTVNLWNMLKQGDTSEDVMLQNGDAIYVPTLPEQALDDAMYRLLLSSSIGPHSFPVRVIGEVKQPGVYDLHGTSPFLASAIARGGGFVAGANRKTVAIRRFSGETQFSTLFVDPNKNDFMLRPNDVVYIAQQKVARNGLFMENVAKVLAPFSSITSTAFSFALMKSYF